jgi:hypothetical protein
MVSHGGRVGTNGYDDTQQQSTVKSHFNKILGNTNTLIIISLYFLKLQLELTKPIPCLMKSIITGRSPFT